MDKQIYIEMHGGRFVQSDRKTGKAYSSAKTPSVSIIGGIQSEVIRDIIRSEPQFLSTGFGARFLMVYPPTKPIRWNHNTVDPEAIRSYELLIEELRQYRERFTPDEPCIVALTPEAKNMIFDFQNRHADNSLDIADGNIRYVENKAGMHCARLALVLHIVKSVEGDTDPVSPVTSETMNQAIAMTEWFLNEAHRIYAMLAGATDQDTPTSVRALDRESTAILKAIDRKGTITKADLLRLHMFKVTGASEVIEAKITALRKYGMIESEFVKNPAGGRGKEVYWRSDGGRTGGATPENSGEN